MKHRHPTPRKRLPPGFYPPLGNLTLALTAHPGILGPRFTLLGTLTRGLVALLGILLLLGAGGAGAQEVSVRAYLEPSNVAVGRTFVLNVEVTGSQSLDSEPQLPDLEEFATYLGSGTSTSMRMVNNRTTVSLTLQHRYQALTEGTHEIPPLEVTVGGERFRTDALTLTVSSSPAPEDPTPSAPSDPTTIEPEDLFVTAEVSRSRVRDGEPFVLEYRIFTRVDVSSYSFTRIPEPQGFWVEELPLPERPQVEEVVRDGKQYVTAVIRRVALVPTGAGERRIDPLGIEAQVRVRRRTLDPFEGFFDFDRSSLFGTVVPTSVASNPLVIEVEPLPPGRPEPFSGVVGSLELEAELNRDSVDANEAVTLSVRATGMGNLRAIPEPTLELPPDFEVYPPEVTESLQRSGPGLQGRKSWEYVLIPRAPGTRTIPSVSLAYFDTGEEVYRTAATEPLLLVVSGEPTEEVSALSRSSISALREDIRFIQLGPAHWTRAGESLFQGGSFWLLLILPMLIVLGAAGFRFQQDRLEADPAYARRRRARRVAHARLAEARRLAGGGRGREFYAEAARALRGFAADKLDLAEAGMLTREVESRLKSHGVSEELIQEVSACLEHCDLQRFAPPKEDSGEEARFLERVSQVMTNLDREMGR